MKKVFKLAVIFLLAMTFVTAPFESSTPFAPNKIEAKVKISKKKIKINKGKKKTLKVTGNKKKVKWESEDTSIAVVNKKGVVKGVSAGTTTVNAIVGSKTLSCEVTVVVPVKSVSISKSGISIDEGENYTLSLEILPEDATDTKVTWKSSKPSVATVDENGVVTGVSKGTTMITAKAGSKSAYCTVYVLGTPPTISLRNADGTNIFSSQTTSSKYSYYISNLVVEADSMKKDSSGSYSTTLGITASLGLLKKDNKMIESTDMKLPYKVEVYKNGKLQYTKTIYMNPDRNELAVGDALFTTMELNMVSSSKYEIYFKSYE